MASVACGGCRDALDELSALEPARRKGCPACGSTTRTFGVELHGTVETHSSFSAKGKRAGATGKHKWVVELFSGASWSRRLQRFVRREMSLDRESDLYFERVIDPANGEVLHECKEPLSDHRGHGSARPGRIDGGEKASDV